MACDAVVWALCELVRRAVAGECRTCEVKLSEEATRVLVTCQDDCPGGLFAAELERALAALRVLNRVGLGARCTTAAAGDRQWRQLVLVGDKLEEREAKPRALPADAATRLEAAVALDNTVMAEVERRVARFLARVVAARACEGGELTVCLVRCDSVVARLSTSSFKRGIAAAEDNCDDVEARRALVAYGKSMMSGAADVVCASASDSRGRVTVARFPPGSLFQPRTHDASRAGFIELIRIVDGEPLVDGFGARDCALCDAVRDFDGFGARPTFAGETPFLRFVLVKSKKRPREDDNTPIGDLVVAVEVEAPSTTEPVFSADDAIRECCPPTEANVAGLLRSCVRQLPRVFDAARAAARDRHVPAILRALDDMANNSNDPTFAAKLRAHPALTKIAQLQP